jgi:type II secretory pathway pseudopilin PulG
MRRQKTSREAGFSLVEAIVGILVIGILIVALYGMQAAVVQKVQLNRESLRATQIMVKKIDQIRLLNWDQINDGITVPATFSESFDPEDNMPGNQGKPQKPPNYRGTLQFTDGPSECPYGSDMKTLTVTLDWTSNTGHARQCSVTTYISKNGIQNYIY